MDLNLLVLSKFGSHLYGTETPESDTDYKGVYLPTIDECLLNKISKSIQSTTGNSGSKNTKEDVDTEIYSLQYFMRLAIQGEMQVIDLLHAPNSMVVKTSPVWQYIQQHRSLFYSKNLVGYLGYIRKQTAKYGVKGSRLAACEEVIETLECLIPRDKKRYTLGEIWSYLPINDYCFFVTESDKFYEVCGRKFQLTISVDYMKDCIYKIYKSYGNRAWQAKENKGIDWKAVSHAFRAGFQLKEIYETKNLVYPLKDAPFIRDVKKGYYHYTNDGISERLENLLEEVESAAENSDLPKKVNVYALERIITEIAYIDIA